MVILMKLPDKGRTRTWAKEDLESAIQEYFNSDLGYNRLSQKYSIPKTTLGRYIRRIKKKRNMEDQSGAAEPIKIAITIGGTRG